MKKILRKLIKILAYTGAFIVILLAIAVGLFRLFLPRVPEYQDEIKARASEAIGMEVEFSGMDARWGLSGPELEFYDAEVIRPDTGVRVLAAEEIRVGVGFLRLLFEQALVVDRLVVRETTVDIHQLEDGNFRVQGVSLDELAGSRQSDAPLKNIQIVGEDIELRFMQPGDERPHFFEIPQVGVSIDDKRIAADADVRLPDELGRQLSVSAIQVLGPPAEEREWNIIIDAQDILLSGWSGIASGPRQFASGIGDLELALAIGNGGVRSVTAEIDFVDIALENNEYFDVSGRLEIAVTDRDWLVAANDFVVSREAHEWPEASLHVEASVNRQGEIVLLDTRASYLRLDDLQLVEPWLNDEQRDLFQQFEPTGVVRNLVATVSEMNSAAARFDVSANLDRIGIVGAGNRPGVSGFSGLLRANRAGGRLEIDSAELEVLAPAYIDVPIRINEADGTVIWRNSANQTTVLSDRIAISSDVFNSQSNIQLILNNDGSSPEIDLASTWSISDLAEAKRYIPRNGLKPKLYDWFQMALVSGAITRGTTTLNGPLDKFPFDGGEGRLLMQGSVRNMTFKYHKDWPATEQSDMEVILDNARLYTTENRSVSAGIPVVNAIVDIPNLRDPVLTIESYSASTLSDIREFSMQSPIAKVFGGQLDRVAVSGDASFTLELMVPLKKERLQEFEFVARVRSNNGTLAIDGFNPPITDLIGEVTIEKEQIASEGLGGRFLGEEVSISLARSEDPQFSVIANAIGTVTADGIVNELGAPLEGFVTGSTPYRASIMFPNGKAEIRSPMTIQIDSDLVGLEFGLPEPIGKTADASLPISGSIQFPSGGEAIETSGFAESRLAWQMAFTKPEGEWDFDRGVVTLGGEVMEPADTRGLHIRGNTNIVRLDDWLNLSKSGEDKVGAADRIRSIDLLVDDLYLVGQHLKDHRVRVDRSALDWLVQFAGDDVNGSVFVPYDFSGDRSMVFDMERLRLPGNEAGSDIESRLDPRKLPAMELRAAEFAFGDRNLGAVEAVLEKTNEGLEAVSISSTDASYSITATGRWIADDNDPLGSHSFVTATLASTNVMATMARLNYQPGIDSERMNMSFDIDWSGSPRADFFSVLNGDVRVEFADGQLREVNPGAGRIFGLMSIVALPRRLSLDFRDVFSKGFSFDKIAGSFKIENGNTQTCDLSLEGPAADIGIVGGADLANRTYKQTAIVSANVGNTLPIVGAVVAGPQVAAVMYIFSKIFKKPLQEVGQVYYAIDGSWDEPTVESTNSAAFVATGEFAGCLANEE